jgi:hypothetical protein
MPVRVTITPAADSVPTNGVVSLEFQQDASQRARIIQPCAVTPGKPTVVEFAACFPADPGEIRVEFKPGEGRGRATARFSSFSSEDGDFPLPRTLSSDRALVAVVGRELPLPQSLPDLWAHSEDRWSMGAAGPAAIPIEALPSIPIAYRALDVLVVRGADTELIEPRALAAIRHWVLEGGRLLIFANGPGVSWRRLLPPGPPGDLLTADEPRRDTLPSEATSRARYLGSGFTRLTADSAVPSGRDAQFGFTPDEIEAPAASMPSAPARPVSPLWMVGPPDPAVIEALASPAVGAVIRPLKLTSRGRDAGWALRWHTGPAMGLIAEGPVGTGMVAVVGVNPSEFSGGSGDAAAGGWAAALEALLGDREETPARESDGWYAGGFAFNTSATSRAGDAALRGTLSEQLDIPPASASTFLLIAVGMGLLALLVGPGDYVLLGRVRRREGTARCWSWLTASLWVGIVGTLALVGPRVMRTSETRLARTGAVDHVAALPGDPVGSDVAFQSALTSLWAGGPMDTWLGEPNGGPAPRRDGTEAEPWLAGVLKGVHARGVSPLPFYRYDATFLPPTVQYLQRPPALQSNDPVFGGFRPDGDASTVMFRGTALGAGPSLPVRSWTLRTFADDRRIAPPFVARVEGNGAAVRVRITGLPPGARIRRAHAEDARGPHAVSVVPDGAGTLLASLGGPERAPDDSGTWRRPLDLTGPAERGLAAEARVRSGRWLALTVHLVDVPPDVALRGEPAVRSTRELVVRSLLPIPESARSAGTPGDSGNEANP